MHINNSITIINNIHFNGYCSNWSSEDQTTLQSTAQSASPLVGWQRKMGLPYGDVHERDVRLELVLEPIVSLVRPS